MDGNLVAQETLYNRYKKIVKDFIKSKYSIYYDIDDDVSEIMIKVFLNLNQFDATKSKFRSWVMVITKNYLIDKWRGNAITLTSFGTQCVTTIPAHNWNDNYTENATLTTSCGNAEWSQNYNSTGLDGAFAISNSSNCVDDNSSVNFLSTQISASDYALLDMKYVQGYNYCEIGKEFNTTSNTISNKVNYIKTKLKKEFSEIMEE